MRETMQQATGALVALLLIVSALWPSAAEAQGASAQMDAGRAALAAGDLDGADRHFLAAHAMGAGTGALYNLGLAALKRGNCDAITFYFSRVLVEQPADPDRPLLEREIGKCAKELGNRGTLRIESKPADALVAVRAARAFGHPAGVHDLFLTAPVEAALPAGRYAVVARKDRYLAVETSAEVEAGKSAPTRVVLTRAPLDTLPVMDPVMPELQAEPVEAPVEAPVVATGPQYESGPLTPWGWTAVGAGAATLGAAVALNLVGDGKMQQANDDEVPGTAPYVDAYNDGRTLHNAGVALYVTGGALVAGGIVMLILDEPRLVESATAVVPWALPDGGGLSASARF